MHRAMIALCNGFVVLVITADDEGRTPVIARLLRTAAAGMALALGTMALPFAGLAAAASPTDLEDPGTVTVQTQWGPLTPGDRSMLIKVRQAGLWEAPTGRQAQQKSTNPSVIEAGKHLVAGHAELDAKVLAIGQQLNVPLPAEPSDQQKGFLAQLATATGAGYDRTFAALLRDSHGSVFNFLAQVRSGTRNSMIRDFAKRCMEVVLDHITMMENTGLVDYSTLAPPYPPAPPATPATTANSNLAVFLLAALMVVAGIAAPFISRLRPAHTP